MILDKIVLNINQYIDILHTTLLTAFNGEILTNMHNGVYRFSPGLRMPITRNDKGVNNRFISSKPYHSFLGSNVLEAYLNNYVLMLGMINTNENFYCKNDVLRRLHLPYKTFDYTEDTLLGLVIDNERALGKLNGDHMSIINKLEKEIQFHMDKLEPLVVDKLCKIDLSREVVTLEILDDIRNFRLRESKNTLEANKIFGDDDIWKIGM